MCFNVQFSDHTPLDSEGFTLFLHWVPGILHFKLTSPRRRGGEASFLGKLAVGGSLNETESFCLIILQQSSPADKLCWCIRASGLHFSVVSLDVKVGQGPLGPRLSWAWAWAWHGKEEAGISVSFLPHLQSSLLPLCNRGMKQML